MNDSKRPGKPAPATARDDSGPRSLTRLLALFDRLSLAPNGLTLAELSVALESPKSSLLNLLRPLVAEGFLVRSVDTYNLGPSIFRLSAGVLSASTMTKAIRPFLMELVARTGESAMWGLLNREVGEVTFTDVVDSPHAVRLQIPAGIRRPLYASPTGWVLLAYAEKSWREQFLASMTPTAETSVPITRALLLREFTKVRTEGTLASIDVPVAGLGSVSAPVFDANGDCVGAVNVAGPSNRFHENVSSLKLAVQQVAAKASAKLSEGSHSAPSKVR